MTLNSTPHLSVVVTVVEDDRTVKRCLEALREQKNAPELEVIVPFDDTIASIEKLAKDYPEVIFLNLGQLTKEPPKNALEQHYLLDCRRAAGLDKSSAPLIAIIEDRVPPAPDWAKAMFDLHKENHHGAIGGAVKNGTRSSVMSAVFLCDFGRYEPPFETAERDYATDINICYKRDAIMKVRDLWQGVYREATVNWGLQERGEKLLLSSRPVVVYQREQRPLIELLSERFHWGRQFGRVRTEDVTRGQAFTWAIAAPALPFLLFLRNLKFHISKGRSLPSFVKLSPVLFALLAFWSLGEGLGYAEATLGHRPATT